MTQEEKELLLIDLSARLLYEVIFNYGDNEGCDYRLEIISNKIIGIDEYSITLNDAFPIEDCKPYLRPMSSMTEEEIKECYQIQQDTIHVTFYKYDEGYDKAIDLPYFESLVDFYNSHHLDYRGLIEKGLALEAPEDMYNIKEK